MAASPCTIIGNILESSPLYFLSIFALAIPSATGATVSRWEGFGTKFIFITSPSRKVLLKVNPIWYFTSPSMCSSSKSFPSNSENKSRTGFLKILVKVFKRPRCAIPKTHSLTPYTSAAFLRATAIAGIRASPPSSENRF